MRPAASFEPEPQQARDVVAFGQEVSRALSDGRIVGRAEPFAKVFPSSRRVKRAVGVTAWVILEDIARDASLDVEGRLVAETNPPRPLTIVEQEQPGQPSAATFGWLERGCPGEAGGFPDGGTGRTVP